MITRRLFGKVLAAMSFPSAGSGFQNPPVGNQGSITRVRFKSPDYSAGVQGWTVNKDGSAEFNNIVIRGGSVVSGTILDYSPNPGANNLVHSRSPGGGFDSFGNAYLAGDVSYTNISGTYFAIQNNSGQIAFYTAASEAGPWSLHVVEKFSTTTGYLGFGPPGAPTLEVADNTTAVFHRSTVDLMIATGFNTVAEDPNNLGSREIFHSLGARGGPAGWSTDHGRYRLLPTGEIEFDIQINDIASGPGVAGTITWANSPLGASYQPAVTRVAPLATNNNASAVRERLFFDTAGNVQVIVGAGTGATRIGGCPRMPLD